MVPVTVMVAGRATVSAKIKGAYGKGRPSCFSEVLRPVVFWNITYKCNLRCAHCYIRAGERAGELSTEEARRLAQELAELGVPLVVISGGEPLAREDLWDVLEPLARRPRPKLALSTNGTLISRDVAYKLVDYGFSYVGVSLDSVKPAEHDAFRGVKGAFEAAVRGIEEAQRAGLSVGVRTTITRYNVNEVQDIVEWCVKKGVERLSLYVLDTVGRAEDLEEWLPTPEQLKKLSDELALLARKYSEHLEILVVRANFVGVYLADRLSNTRDDFVEYLDMLEAQGDCGRKTASIYPSGDVKPCQFVDWVELGNVREKKLREILREDNPALKPFLAVHEMLRGPRCSSCQFRRVCGGGSRSRARAVHGDPWADDPLCFIDYKAVARKWKVEDLF